MKRPWNLRSRAAVKKEPGHAAIVSVLVLFSVATLVTVTGVLTTLDTAKNAFVEKESSKAFYLADGCIEEGLYRYKKDETYVGSNLNVNGESCIINVTGEGTSKTISAKATVGDQTRSIQVIVNRSPFTIEHWEETQ